MDGRTRRVAQERTERATGGAERTGRATGSTGARSAQAARDRRADGADAPQGNDGGNPAKRHGATTGRAVARIEIEADGGDHRKRTGRRRTVAPVGLSACRLPGDGRTDAARCPGANGTRHRQHRSAQRTGTGRRRQRFTRLEGCGRLRVIGCALPVAIEADGRRTVARRWTAAGQAGRLRPGAPVSLSACRLPVDGRRGTLPRSERNAPQAAQSAQERETHKSRPSGGRTARTRHRATAAAIRRSGTTHRPSGCACRLRPGALVGCPAVARCLSRRRARPRQAAQGRETRRTAQGTRKAWRFEVVL